jgi:hypothetical protein
MRRKVDLPAPERPITPTNCPRGMLSDRSETAADLPNAFVTPSRTSTANPKRTFAVSVTAGPKASG